MKSLSTQFGHDHEDWESFLAQRYTGLGLAIFLYFIVSFPRQRALSLGNGIVGMDDVAQQRHHLDPG